MRDWIAIMEGKKLTTIREFCGICDLNGKMMAWINTHPTDAEEPAP